MWCRLIDAFVLYERDGCSFQACDPQDLIARSSCAYVGSLPGMSCGIRRGPSVYTTPHRPHHRRSFSRVRHTSSTYMRWFKMSCAFESAFSQESSCRHVFHRKLLGVPHHPPLFPTPLVTDSGTTCADPRSGSWLGRMAEQSPITPSRVQTQRRISRRSGMGGLLPDVCCPLLPRVFVFHQPSEGHSDLNRGVW